jgi:hypothetical protein
MERFSPGDLVVAVRAHQPGPICGPPDPGQHLFRFPDGPLRNGVVYHVAAVGFSRDGNQALWLTGLRVVWGPRELPWNSSRFRKIRLRTKPARDSASSSAFQPQAVAACVAACLRPQCPRIAPCQLKMNRLVSRLALAPAR